ncbi:MAG: hypothetical protein M1820_010052 [Bogoriella megaspora]|nr:MAG: hypothetical protein M1820_010052 [Bogoriella megaspora]
MGFENIPDGQPNPWEDASLRPVERNWEKERFFWQMCGVLSKIENVQYIAELPNPPPVHRATTHPIPLPFIVSTPFPEFEPRTVNFISVDHDAHAKLRRWSHQKGFEVGISHVFVELDGVRLPLRRACDWVRKTGKKISEESLAALVAELEDATSGRAGKSYTGDAKESN